MKTPVHQAVLTWASWALTGVLTLGAILGAISNAITLITPRVTYTGSVLLCAAWLTAQLLLRRYPITWATADGTTVKINRLGLRSSLPFGGMVLLLWVPLLMGRVSAGNEPFASFELIVSLPRTNSFLAAADYQTLVNTLAAGQSDCDVTFEVRFLSARFPFRQTLYVTSGLRDLRVYILPFSEDQWKRPPTWRSYGFNWDQRFQGPVVLQSDAGGPVRLSVRASPHDLAQLGPEVSMRAIDGWDVELAITWTGTKVKDIHSSMELGRQLAQLIEFPAIVRINGVETWQGLLSQRSSGYAEFLPYPTERGNLSVWRFTRHYGTSPKPYGSRGPA